jgi:hypothetical protein
MLSIVGDREELIEDYRAGAVEEGRAREMIAREAGGCGASNSLSPQSC